MLSGRKISEAMLNGKMVFSKNVNYTMIMPNPAYSARVGNFNANVPIYDLLFYGRAIKEYFDAPIVIGNNAYPIGPITQASVCFVMFDNGSYHSMGAIDNFKIKVNSINYDLNQAVNYKLIEPMVLISGETRNTTWNWVNILNLYKSMSSYSTSYAYGMICFISKDGTPVEGVSFTSNKATGYLDGFDFFWVPVEKFNIGFMPNGGYGDGSLNLVEQGYNGLIGYTLSK